MGEEGETELGDLIGDTSILDPEEAVVQQEEQQLLNEAIKKLSKREQILIKLHFNLSGEGEHSLETLRKNWGMKREEVRDFLDKTLKKLKRNLGKLGRKELND